MGPSTVLIVDDERSVLAVHARALAEFHPLTAEGGAAARAILESTRVDVVVTDLFMPDLDGLALMQWAKESGREPSWIVASGVESFDLAVEALKLGAVDFLPKPLVSPALLQAAVLRALQQRGLVDERERLLAELSDRNDALERTVADLHRRRTAAAEDLHRAQKIMAALLPAHAPALGKMRVHACHRPSGLVGGDLYDAVLLDDGRIAVYVADAAGHGVSAAMLSVLFKQRLRTCDAHKRRSLAPRHVLSEVNVALLEECAASGLFVTAAYAVVDPAKKRATIASAGHPPCFVLRRGGEVEALHRTGPALGLSAQSRYEERQVRLDEHDGLLLYTDGLYARNPEEEDTIADRVSALARDAAGDPAFLRRLAASAEDEQSEAREDDVTLVLLRAEPGLSTLEHGLATGSSPPRSLSSFASRRVGDTLFVRVRGSCGWRDAQALYTACLATFSRGERALIDLGGCTGVDSTVLGTLQLMAAHAAPGRLLLQNVPGAIRANLEELSMGAVLACIQSSATLVPDDLRDAPEAGAGVAGDLMLRAHEALASLSPRNLVEFGGVVQELRRDVARSHPLG